MADKAGVFRQTFASTDIQTDRFGTYLLIVHNLGTMFPLAWIYFPGALGQEGSPAYPLFAVDANTTKYYVPSFSDPVTITVTG